MRRLGLLLCLILVARAGDDPVAPVMRIHDLADLKTDEAWWAVAVNCVNAAAEGAQVRAEKNNLIVVAPPAVQEKVEKELTAMREAFGTLVKMEVRLAKIEGGAGVASVPADRIDAFLQEKHAKDLSTPKLSCRNGQRTCIESFKELSYISDFDVTLDDKGDVIADPVVDTLKCGITAKLRPFVSGTAVRVVAEVSVTDVAVPWRLVELPLPVNTPLKVQVPECTTWSVTKLLDCAADSYTVIDLGGPWVVLIRATPVPGKGLAGKPWPGQEVPLK